MKIEEHFEALKKAVDDRVMELEIQVKDLQRDSEDLEDDLEDHIRELQKDLSDAQDTLDQARELATEIERRFALRLDPGPTERDFRELLALLTEDES